MPGKLMTAEEAAEYLRVPIRTLYDWRLKKTGPPSLRVGKFVRFREVDLEEWISERLAAERNGAA